MPKIRWPSARFLAAVDLVERSGELSALTLGMGKGDWVRQAEHRGPASESGSRRSQYDASKRRVLCRTESRFCQQPLAGVPTTVRLCVSPLGA